MRWFQSLICIDFHGQYVIELSIFINVGIAMVSDTFDWAEQRIGVNDTKWRIITGLSVLINIGANIAAA
ncbi:hypothetical protein EVA_19111 [gut metagenome]|uniref:Uncharacterized protein n=1 Tax=gut metagenome TaxID=749906 RepID=J9FT83_9ZZZZ